ncbi:ABC transporter permease, partial [Staphylococcus equorum]
IVQFSFVQLLLWTLPPISSILYLLNKDSIHIFNLDFIMLCIHSFIYIVIFFQMINYFFNRQ